MNRNASFILAAWVIFGFSLLHPLIANPTSDTKSLKDKPGPAKLHFSREGEEFEDLPYCVLLFIGPKAEPQLLCVFKNEDFAKLVISQYEKQTKRDPADKEWQQIKQKAVADKNLMVPFAPNAPGQSSDVATLIGIILAAGIEEIKDAD